MQFVGGKGVALFIVIITGVCAVGFGTGLLVGRQFPVHHYELYGNTRYLVDSATGRICNPLISSDGTDLTSLIYGAGNKTPVENKSPEAGAQGTASYDWLFRTDAKIPPCS